MPVYSFDANGKIILEKVFPDEIGNGVYEVANNVAFIGDKALVDCNNILTAVLIPESVEAIGYAAFANTGLTHVDIPESVVRIGPMAFAKTGLTSVFISYGVKVIGYAAFAHTSLTHVDIPESVVRIDDRAFAHTSLTHVDIPKSVKVIGRQVFNDCNDLAIVVIPKSVTAIGEDAFASSVFIPKSVTAIGKRSFVDHPSLQVIAIDAEGAVFERIKGLLPRQLHSVVISLDEFNQIQAVQAEACRPHWIKIRSWSLPDDVWGIVGSLGGLIYEMQQIINTVALPKLEDERWGNAYLEALNQAFSLNESVFAAPVPEKETKSQEGRGARIESIRNQPNLAVAASQVGFFRPANILETKRPEEPQPRPAY